MKELSQVEKDIEILYRGGTQSFKAITNIYTYVNIIFKHIGILYILFLVQSIIILLLIVHK
jgi:hypothetical protein